MRNVLTTCRLAVGAIFFGGTFVLAPLVASAQILTVSRQAAIAEGFTASDLNNLETTQIAPHFRLYRQWTECVANASVGVIYGDRPIAETINIPIAMCSEKALELRASLAAVIGLAPADRIRRLIEFDARYQLRAAHLRQHPALPTGSRTIGRWTGFRASDQICGAVMLFAGSQDYDVSLIEVEGQTHLFLRTSHIPGPSSRTTLVRRIVRSDPDTDRVRELPFTLSDSDGRGTLSVLLTPDLQRFFGSSRYYQVMGGPKGSESENDPSMLEHFEIADLDAAVAFVQHCS